VTINASTAGGPTKTQTLSLAVSVMPMYTLTIPASSLTTQVNSPATFQGTLTAINGYDGAVTLNCAGDAPPSCVANPGSVVPAASGAAFSITASSGVAQAYSFTINAVGSDSNSVPQSVPVTLTVLPNASFDFTLGATPSSVSVAVGKTAAYTVAVAPTTNTFLSNVSFTCSGLPALSSCTFNPAQVASGSGNSVVALSIATTAPGPPSSAALLLGAFPLAALVGLWRPRRARERRRALSSLILALVLALYGCGGGLQGNGSISASGSPGTPKGSYNVTITATSGSVSHSTAVNLTVTN
jgi:hypothetical protein